MFFKDTKLKCDTPKLKEFITSWCENDGWTFDEFAKFLKLVGVHTPVKMRDLKTNSFKCTDSNGKVWDITLRFGQFNETDSTITIEDESETKVYETYICSKVSPKPTVTCLRRIIRQNGKSLDNNYQYYFHSVLSWKERKLLIKIDNTSHLDDVLRNNVEAYLLSLDEPVEVDDIYKSIISLMNYSEEDISNHCREIIIELFEGEGQKKKTRAGIHKKYLKMVDYAVLENGETFRVFDSGNWEFCSDSGITITFSNGNYNFSMNGKKEDIEATNPKELLTRVYDRIITLMGFVK